MAILLQWLLGFVLACSCLRAAEGDVLAEVRRVDAERVAAMVAGDRSRMEAVFSDRLRYVHSNGAVDTKATLIEAIVGGRMRYLAFEEIDRVVEPVNSDVALVSGRSRMKVQAAEQRLDLTISYLAIYRHEDTRWRLVAWQSARLPEAK